MFNIWPTTIYQQPPPLSGSGQPTVIPASLAKHPQQWTKHEVGVWLKWCSEEYCIEPIPPDKIDMNGKALCLLNRSDFMERIPRNGDVLYNALQTLIQKNVNIINPMSSVCNVRATIPMNPFIKAESISPIMNPLVLTSANTQTTSMHAPSRPRPCVPILPHTQSSLLPPNCSNHMMQHNKHFSNTVSTVPGILSPAPSNVDTDSASSDNVSVSDPEGQEKEDNLILKTNDRFLPTTIKTEIQHSIQSAFQAVTNVIKPESECRLLWEFIHQLLQNTMFSHLVCWENEKEFIFRINNPTGLANMWGQQKNRTNMTYEKLSRALRYYYRMNIIKKVSGKRLTYKFMQQPSTIQKGQRGAKPHHKCDLSILPSANRCPYPGFNEEATNENIPQISASSCGPVFSDGRHDAENYRQNKTRPPHFEAAIHSDKSPNFPSPKIRDLENHDESMVQLSKECMTNSNFKNFSSNFQIPQTSFDKKLPPLMVRANISNDLQYSPEDKLKFNGYINPSFETFHNNTKQTVDTNLKRRYVDGITSPQTHIFCNHFKEEPQEQPEDLSLVSKKKRTDFEHTCHSEKGTPILEDETNYSKDEENNILPLLINYKKTPVSEDS